MKKKYIGIAALMLLSVCSKGFAAEKSSVKPNGCEGPVLCPSYDMYERCSDCCDYRWHVDIGLLYEQPWMPYMIAGVQEIDKTPSLVKTEFTTYQILEQCFDYSLGVVASLGYFMEYDNYYIGAKFDWISASSSKPYNQTGAYYSPFGFLSNDATYPFNFEFYYVASIEYSANIDIYDLTVFLSRGSYHSKSFSYEPYMGVKALWYNGDQKNILYGGGRGTNPDYYFAVAASSVTQNRSFKAWGAGPEFGFNGEYHVTCNLSLFSDSSVAVLYGNVDTTGTNSVVDSVTPANTASYVWPITYKQTYFVPIRSIIGLKLGKYCLEDKHYVAVKIGYDARYVFADTGNQFTNGGYQYDASGPNPGYNIASSGLFVDFIWDF